MRLIPSPATQSWQLRNLQRLVIGTISADLYFDAGATAAAAKNFAVALSLLMAISALRCFTTDRLNASLCRSSSFATRAASFIRF